MRKRMKEMSRGMIMTREKGMKRTRTMRRTMWTTRGPNLREEIQRFKRTMVPVPSFFL